MTTEQDPLVTMGSKENENDDDVPGLFLGDHRSGESVTLNFTDEAEAFESDEYGDGIRVPAEFISSDLHHTDEDGNEIVEGDSVNLVSWSARLVDALREFRDGVPAGTLSAAEPAVITKEGTGFDTQYTVEPAE